MCCVLDASKILICITFGQGTKVLLTCWLTWNDNLSSQPLFARAVLKLRGTVPLLLWAARGYGLIAGSALPGFYVVPHCGHRSAPRMLAGLADVVHDRQRADSHEHNRNEEND